MVKATAPGAKSLLALVGLALGACGVISKQDLKVLGGKDEKSQEANGTDAQKTEINIELKEQASGAGLVEQGFSLVNSSAFVMNITGCASGYTANAVTSVASTKSITLYKHDRSCQADLTQFTFSGNTYTKVGGGSLAGTTNSAAEFVNGADANDKVMVRAHTVLPSPLTDAATATFVFQQLKLGADHAIANYTFSETLEVVGVESANVSIQDVSLTAIAPDGKATFLVTFQCPVAMTVVGVDHVCASAGADNHKISNMRARLISDSYTGVLTYAQAATETTGGAAGMVSITNANKVVGQNRFTVSVAGQGALYTNKNMLLILAYDEPSATSLGTSYKYFNVDIGNP